MASEAITLLKNDENVLPLSKNTKVLVAGPNANSMRTLNGAWTYSWQGEKTPEYTEQYNTILEAIQGKVGKENVSYASGVSYKMDGKYYEDQVDDIDAAVEAAARTMACRATWAPACRSRRCMMSTAKAATRRSKRRSNTS